MQIKNQSKTILSMRSELTELLYQNYPIGFCATLILASVSVWELLTVEHAGFLIWYIGIIIILLCRLGLLAWYKHTKNKIELLPLHYGLFILGSSITALQWGILASFLMPQNNLQQAFVIIIVTGIIAGAVQSLMASYIAYILYVFMILVPLLAWEILEIKNGNHMYIGIFIAMVFYSIYMATVGARGYKILKNNIHLKFENMELFENLKNYTSHIELLTELAELLAKCISEKEVCEISGKYINQMYPEFSGDIYVLSEKGDCFEVQESWGNVAKTQKIFSKKDCFAVRYGRMYQNSAEVCKHCHQEVGFYLCIPFMDQKEVFGLLHLERESKEPLSEVEQNKVFRIASDIALTLVNLKLKNSLKKQATHDLLTGLFNRQYLQDYLEMEFYRVKRKKLELFIILLDIDNFKQFNDNFGHEMGDAILREIGVFLTSNVRGNDIACRYGGEEFIIVMSEITRDIVQKRAELLREGFKELAILSHNKQLKGITISLGVASYPQNGFSIDEVIDAADKAMYHAKELGRDQVCFAPGSNLHS